MANIEKAKELIKKAFKEIGYSSKTTVEYLLSAQHLLPAGHEGIEAINKAILEVNSGYEVDVAAMNMGEALAGYQSW